VKVLLLTTSGDLSGAERICALVARGLVSRRYDVTVGCLQPRSGALLRELEADPIRTFSLNAGGWWDPRPWKRLTRLLRASRFDLIYTFLYHANILGRVCARAGGRPCVVSSQHSERWESPWRNIVTRATDRWCDRVVAVSAPVERFLIERVGIPAAKVVQIPNGIDTDEFQPGPPVLSSDRDEVVIGSAARFDAQKDHETLIVAFRFVLEANPRVRLWLAGDGPRRHMIERLARRLGAADRVTFLGQVADMPAFYRQLDTYVQSTRAEGLSLALLEAMACARPVVASAVGGNEQIVENDRSGVLVPPGDALALARALSGLIDQPDRARLIAERGRRRVVESFSASRMVDRVDALFRSLVCEGAREEPKVADGRR